MSLDYVLEFQANINILKEFDISKKEKFRSYELIGTFTDEYGNYGKLEGIIISDIKDNKLIKLEGTAKTIYANNEVLYIKAFTCCPGIPFFTKITKSSNLANPIPPNARDSIFSSISDPFFTVTGSLIFPLIYLLYTTNIIF